MNDQGLFGGCMISDMQIHCVISFAGHPDHKIDEQRMAKAVKLTLDAEPILGCRFAVRRWRMLWERRTDLHEAELFSFAASENTEAEMLRFLSEPSDPCKDLMVKVLLLRSDTKDRLCIKVSHLAADAAGVKDYAYLLASVYRKLADNPGYRPVPNLNGSRSMRQISRQFGFLKKIGILRRTLTEVKQSVFPRKHCSFPLIKGDPADRAFVIRRISPELFREIRAYGKRHGATLNDVLLTAICRSFFDLIQPAPDVPLRLISTADLRRYLPSGKAEAICNLSGIFHLKLNRKPDDDFKDTLIEIHRQMNFIKNDFIGLGYHPIFVLSSLLVPASLNLRIGKKKAEKLLDGDRKTPPGFTNMGAIDTEQLVFGDAEVTDAFLTAPVMFSPLLLIGLSGFGESLTMSVGFSNAAVNKPLVERVLNCIEKETPPPAPPRQTPPPDPNGIKLRGRMPGKSPLEGGRGVSATGRRQRQNLPSPAGNTPLPPLKGGLRA